MSHEKKIKYVIISIYNKKKVKILCSKNRESYMNLWNTGRKDRRYNRVNMNKSARDSRRYIQPLCRINLDRDLYTFVACKPY